MNQKKLIVLLICITFGGLVYSEGIGFEYDGEVRTRLAYVDNFAMDFRAQIDFTLTTSIPLYIYYKLQLGNMGTDVELFDSNNFLENIKLKSRNLYFGWEDSVVNVKAGLINTDSPSGVVIDDENAGIKIKVDFEDLKIKTFYSMTNLVDEYFNFAESSDNINHLFFLGADTDQYLNLKLNLWTMFYNGNESDIFSFNSLWTGLKLENENDYFDIESSFVYNGGHVDLNDYSLDIPISAFYTNMKISTELVEDSSIFSRINLVGSMASDSGSVNQFQVIDGEGNLDTGLGLLFGGSSYSNESYFSSESVSLVEDNLSSGDLVLDDPGLFIYEFGFSEDFDFLPFSSELIIGGANTSGLFSGTGYLDSLLGLEADLHNKMEIADGLDFNLSLSMLFPGNAFKDAFSRNNTDSDISTDTSYKVDCKLVYSF